MSEALVTVEAAIAVLSEQAGAVRQRYAAFEQRKIGREWTTAELMSGFVVDVGDLQRLVMAATGARHIDDARKKLEHELADCLWSVLVLAERLDIDLAAAFTTTMGELTAFLDADGP
jgi:NTP pyrophosphatase (non-canonical NTP hydrolase)